MHSIHRIALLQIEAASDLRNGRSGLRMSPRYRNDAVLNILKSSKRTTVMKFKYLR